MVLQDLGHMLNHCIFKQQLVQTTGTWKWGDPVQSHHSRGCSQMPSASALCSFIAALPSLIMRDSMSGLVCEA